MAKRLNPFLFIITLLFVGQLSFAQSSYSPNRFLIVFDASATQDDINEALEDLNCTEIWVSPISSTRLWEVNYFPFEYPPTNTTIYNINEENSTARNRAKVQEAGLDYAAEEITDLTDSAIPGGNSYDHQMDCYGLVSSYAATDVNSVEVGVFDTGFTYPEITEYQEYYFTIKDYIQHDYLENDQIAEDFHGHGTHISSVIAHLSNKDANLHGYVPPDVSFNMCKTFDNSGYGYIAEIIYAFEEAVIAGLHIANFSWSFKETREEAELSPLRHCIEHVLSDYDVLMVCAAGNNGEDIDDNLVMPNWPAAYTFNNILTVGTFDCSDDLASFSNYGDKSVDIVAPGYKIAGLTSEGLTYKTGTSQSTSIVTAVAATLATHQTEFDASEIKCAIILGASETFELNPKTVSNGYLNTNNALSILGLCFPTKRKNDTALNKDQIYPNPLVGNDVTIKFNADEEDNYLLSLYNQLGQLVEQLNVSAQLGYNDAEFKINDSGLYLLEISNKKKKRKHKIIKL